MAMLFRITVSINIIMTLEIKIYQYLINQEKSRDLAQNKMETYLTDNEAYNASVQDIKNRLKVKLSSGKCSNVLIQQLARHQCGLGEKYVENIEFYNSSEILDIIELIELGKIKGKSFNRCKELKEYSHVHHNAYSSLGYSIIRNIREFWFRKEKIKKNLRNDFEIIESKYGKSNIAAIMNTMHSKTIKEKLKNNKLNGEWLIYREHNDHNYYLCLATHKEGDLNIYNNKLQLCISEFSELA
jgi:hypothetical protein